MVILLTLLEPVRDRSRTETRNHELERKGLGAASVVAAGGPLEVPEGTSEEQGDTDGGDEARGRHDGVADVNDHLPLEELPELKVEGRLVEETHLIGEAGVGVGAGNDFVDGALARVDGLDLFLEHLRFGRRLPSLDEAVGLGSERVGVDFG